MSVKRLIIHSIPSLAILVGVTTGVGYARAGEEPLSQRDASNMIAVSDVKMSGNQVSGTVTNRSSNEMQDIRLLIRQAWQWQKETRPGKVSPGRTLVFTLNRPIPAGGSAPFTFDVPPLPNAKGGTFKTTAEVAGFTEMVPNTNVAGE